MNELESGEIFEAEVMPKEKQECADCEHFLWCKLKNDIEIVLKIYEPYLYFRLFGNGNFQEPLSDIILNAIAEHCNRYINKEMIKKSVDNIWETKNKNKSKNE